MINTIQIKIEIEDGFGDIVTQNKLVNIKDIKKLKKIEVYSLGYKITLEKDTGSNK